MTAIVQPFLENAAVSSNCGINRYFGTSEQVSNTNPAPYPPVATPGGVSVDATVQFIRAHYDSLFRRLAE
jgi:hypothetical protein